MIVDGLGGGFTAEPAGGRVDRLAVLGRRICRGIRCEPARPALQDYVVDDLFRL